MTGLLDAKHSLDPRDNFMTGRIRRFVEVDHAGGDVGLEIALVRGAAYWDRCEVTCSDEYCSRVSVRYGKSNGCQYICRNI